MNDLPSEIISNILSRLPSPTTISCKCVCKRWHKLLSSPDFVKFHLSVSTPELLALEMHPKGECLCKFVEDEGPFQDQHKGFRWHQGMKFDPKAFITSPEDYLVEVKGSVDGFLCLQYSSEIDDVICVCNPITREYISLPRLAPVVKYSNFTHYGFGVSSKTGQYKVIYMLQKSVQEEWQRTRSQNYECECYDYLVYTLGAGSWRTIAGNSPFEQAHLSFGLFLNGNLHGLVENSESNILISCFDLEDESFKPFSPPPYSLSVVWFGNCDVLGVLDNCLSICDCSSLGDEGGIVFWTMKEYGVTESWTRQFIFVGTQICTTFPYNVAYPIRAYKNGDLLFSWRGQMVFYYSNKTKTSHKVDVSAQEFPDKCVWMKTILHNSSFLSLESFKDENVTPFAVRSGP